MNLSDLNVLLLNYPFMSNPRYCLGCTTHKIDLYSFIFLQLLLLCPVHNPFLPILRQPAGKAQLSPFSTTKCIPHVPRRMYYSMCLENNLISPFTHTKMEGLTTKLLHCKKAIFVTPCAFVHRFYLFTI